MERFFRSDPRTDSSTWPGWAELLETDDDDGARVYRGHREVVDVRDLGRRSESWIPVSVSPVQWTHDGTAEPARVELQPHGAVGLSDYAPQDARAVAGAMLRAADAIDHD